MPDKLTDNDIKKGLKTYSENARCGCCDGEDEYLLEVVTSSLDYINRLEAEVKDLETITGLMNNRKYYRKFVDEVYRKQEGKELSDPDFDYIYELYFKQQAENERLKGIKTTDWLVKGISKEQLQEEKIQALTEEINLLQEENERLNKEVDRLSQVVLYNDSVTEMKAEEAKAEAYKEFAERLCAITKAIPEMKIYCIRENDFENLLKEMVGE